MKKRLPIMLASVLLLTSLCACGGNEPVSSAPMEEITTTTTTTTAATTTTTTTIPTATFTTTQKPTTATAKTATTTAAATTTQTPLVLDVPKEYQPQYTPDTARSAETDVGDLYDNGYIYFFDAHYTKKLCRMHPDDRKVTSLPITSAEFAVYKDQVFYLADGCIYRYNTKTKVTDAFQPSADVKRFLVAGNRIYVISQWVDSPHPFLHCFPLEEKEGFDLNIHTKDFGSDMIVLGCNRGNLLFSYTYHDSYDSTMGMVDYRSSRPREVKYCSDRLYYSIDGVTRYIYPNQELTLRGDYTIQFSHGSGYYVAINMLSKRGTLLDIPIEHRLTKDYAVHLSESNGQQQVVFTDWSNRKATVALPSRYTRPSLREASVRENLVLLDCVNRENGKTHTLAVFHGGTVLDLTASALQ